MVRGQAIRNRGRLQDLRRVIPWQGTPCRGAGGGPSGGIGGARRLSLSRSRERTQSSASVGGSRGGAWMRETSRHSVRATEEGTDIPARSRERTQWLGAGR